MNLQVKRKWLKALRSGKYKQTKQRLHGRNGYCCLGVLCDLYKDSPTGKENNTRWEFNGDDKYNLVDENGTYEGSSLPQVVLNWAGINNSDPIVSNNAVEFCRKNSLSTCNKGIDGDDDWMCLSVVNDNSRNHCLDKEEVEREIDEIVDRLRRLANER